MDGRRRSFLPVLAMAAGALTLAGCAETKLAVHTAKELSGTATPAVSTTGIGPFKVGNPYQINGVWYHPQEDYAYVEEGAASWYGPGFHGKLTANGEVYDQYAVTAAHRTLPMPSLVRVTNLENGRAIVVRINDRGPFARNRIIDLSKRSAQLLDMIDQGTARVRVEVLPEESRALKAAALGRSPAPAVAVAPMPTPSAPVTITASAPISGAPVITAQAAVTPAVLASTPTTVGGVYIQAGSFSSADNVRRLEQQFSSVAPVVVTPVTVNGQQLLRVRLGPVATQDAGRVLDVVRSAGLPGARVVAD